MVCGNNGSDIQIFPYNFIPIYPKFYNIQKVFMKYIIGCIVALLITAGCGKKEESKFEAFNPEAFAYDLGESWEVNSTVNLRGFNQKESEGEFSASISFSVDLETPSGEIINSIFEDTSEKSGSESIPDLQLEAQFGIDSTYVLGKYLVHFNIKDNFSGEVIKNSVEFELTK